MEPNDVAKSGTNVAEMNTAVLRKDVNRMYALIRRKNFDIAFIRGMFDVTAEEANRMAIRAGRKQDDGRPTPEAA